MASRGRALLVTVAGLWIACNSNGPQNGDAGLGSAFVIHFQSSADTVVVAPNGSRQLWFYLLDGQAQPLSNRVLQFQIADVALARGATLSLDRGVTDATGSVSLQLIAGLATTFQLTVSAENANRVVVNILVDPRKHGPVDVAPMVVGTATDSVTSIHLFFVPDALCASVPRSKPPTEPFPMRTLQPGQVERYSAVSMDDGHAIVAHGLDATGVMIADGCVDLSGSAILEEVPVRVVLPISARPVSPVGRFRVTSQLRLGQTTPKAVTALTEAWSEISACRTDPGRLWLDCTVDALGPETPEDPLDCVVSTADEGAFEGRLAARRGLRQTEMTPTGTTYTRCRQPTDGAGRASLETQIEGMFSRQNLPALRTNLEAISKEVSKLLSEIGVQSYFEVTATSRPNHFQLDHQLEALELGETGAKVAVNLWSLGLPVRTARLVPAVTMASDISLQQHGFTLRLGSAARLALEQGVLARRGYPGETAAFIASIFASASYLDRGTTFKGCPALAALVCPLVGGTDGCIVDACQAGVTALSRRLVAVFGPLNGTGIDLFLEGTAPLIERDGDGRADSFGWLLPSSVPGVWSGQLRAGDQEHPILGIFTADREGN